MTGKNKSCALIASLMLGSLLAGCQQTRPSQLYFDWDSFVHSDDGHYRPSAAPPRPEPAPVYTPEPVRPVARPEAVTAETLTPVPQARPAPVVRHPWPAPSGPDAAPPQTYHPQTDDAVADDTANLPLPRHAPRMSTQNADTSAEPSATPLPRRADRSQFAASSAAPAADAAPADAPVSAVVDKPVRPAKTASAMPFSGTEHFGWPLHGTVVADFGTSADGQRNDGINIAVPAGTPIVAAAEGTVGYAGGDMKSYGNLVVLRHDGNYFTAYAHAEKLLVKTGDHVKAGQTIGYAGQTGDVESPQLHFEIRKGHEPVDPRKFLGARG